MPEITIDNVPLSFAAGESVIEAATRHQVEIPHYCWHPRLSVAANCRMCLVEVEKAPKLVPACQTECKEGMVVHTANERVKTAQRQVHEFLLVNHPIDCPICDQAGECKLQDYYMRYQLTPSRMREPKVYKPKLTRLGPHVVYNAQRCIMCTRCVRFMDEVAGERQLGVLNRGDHSEIGTFPGQPLDSAYSLNTVDICPVGALTSTVFRFKQRVWNLKRSASICPGCSKGCNVRVDQRSGQVYRLLARENQAVNQSWLCDEGRLTYAWANDRRLTTPLCKDGDFFVAATNLQALAEVRSKLGQALSRDVPWAIGVGLSLTNEDAYALVSFVSRVAPKATFYALGRADGVADALLRQADKNPNRAGITRVLSAFGFALNDAADLAPALAGGQVGVALLAGHDTPHAEAIAKALPAAEVSVQLATTQGPMTEQATIALPTLAWVETEGTWLSGDGRLQALAPAYAPSGPQSLTAWLQALANSLEVSWQAPTSVAVAQSALAQVGGAFAGVSFAAVGPLGLALATSEKGAPAAAVG